MLVWKRYVKKKKNYVISKIQSKPFMKLSQPPELKTNNPVSTGNGAWITVLAGKCTSHYATMAPNFPYV